MVHLVDYKVYGVSQFGTFVLAPAFGVGVLKVYNGTALSVHPYSLGKDAWCEVGLCVVIHAEEIILAFEVVLDGELPFACPHTFHAFNELCLVVVGIANQYVDLLYLW